MRLEFVIAGAFGAVLAFGAQLILVLANRSWTGHREATAGGAARAERTTRGRPARANPRVVLARDTLGLIAIGSFGMAAMTVAGPGPAAEPMAATVSLRAPGTVSAVGTPTPLQLPPTPSIGVSGGPATRGASPVAAFAASINVGGAPLAVILKDAAGHTSTREWDFGSAGARAGRVTTHTFGRGQYDVTVIGGQAPLEVGFRDLSVGAVTSWTWDFGDGGTSAGAAAIHTFGVGEHVVTLTIVGASGQDTTTMTFQVSAGTGSPDGLGLTGSN